MGRSLDVWLGILFIAIGFIGAIIHVQQNVFVHLLWLSNHWAILNGIGFLMRSSFIFSYIVALGIIPEIIWIADFLFMLSGHQFFGVTNYMFEPTYPSLLVILALQHLINPFASLFGIWRFGFHKKSWIGSIVHGASLWLIIVLFTAPSQNVNCVWKTCSAQFRIPDSVWQIALPLATIVHIMVVLFIFTRMAKIRRIKLIN